MTASRHKNLNPLAPEFRCKPVEIVSFGGQGFVVNSDALTAETDPDDLLENIAGTTAAYLIPVGGASYMGLTYHWTDVAAATVNAAPVVRAYGKVKNPEGSGVRFHPQDLVSDFPDLHAASLLASDNSWDARGLWVPLTMADYATGTPEITLSGTTIRHLFNADANQYVVSEEFPVFLAGVEDVIVFVSTAGTFTSGSDPKGVVVGRLFG